MDRYELSLRRSTTLYRLDDEEIVSRATSFRNFVDSIDYSNYDPRFVVAMDETAVYYGNSHQTTVEQRGVSTGRMPLMGYESACVTCILAIEPTGEKYLHTSLLRVQEIRLISRWSLDNSAREGMDHAGCGQTVG